MYKMAGTSHSKVMFLFSPACMQLLQALASSLSVYYNYTGQSKCYNLGLDATADLGELGWSFQVSDTHTPSQHPHVCMSIHRLVRRW